MNDPKPVSKIVGKIDISPESIKNQEKKRYEPKPLKQNLGDLLKDAMEKAKWKAS